MGGLFDKTAASAGSALSGALDKAQELGSAALEKGYEGLDYMTGSEDDFIKQYMQEQADKFGGGPMRPVDEEAMRKKAQTAWRDRQINRKLIGGALGAGVGALMHDKGVSAVPSSTKSYSTGGGALGTGYIPPALKNRGVK